MVWLCCLSSYTNMLQLECWGHQPSSSLTFHYLAQNQGDWAFSVAAPKLWKSLPFHIRSVLMLWGFKSLLRPISLHRILNTAEVVIFFHPFLFSVFILFLFDISSFRQYSSFANLDSCTIGIKINLTVTNLLLVLRFDLLALFLMESWEKFNLSRGIGGD